MSDTNKTFKVDSAKKEPYSYVSAELDLSKLPIGTYYFNSENNFEYTKNWFNYSKFTTIPENAIIKEVVQYSSPDIIPNTLDTSKDYTITSTSLNGNWNTKIDPTTTGDIYFQSKSTNDTFGNIYVGGTYSVASVDAYSTINPPVNIPIGVNNIQYHSYLTKYSPSGNLLWATRIEPGVDTSASILDITCSNGSIYVFGWYGYYLNVVDPTNGVITIYNSDGTPYYYNPLDPTPYSIPPASANQGQNTDAFLIKYDSTGFVQWATRMSKIKPIFFENSFPAIITDSYFGIQIGNIVVDSQGDIVLSLQFGETSFTAYNTPGLINTLDTISTETSTNALLIKYNSLGVAQWIARIQGDVIPGFGSALTIDPANNIYLCGNYVSINDIYNASDNLSDIQPPPSALDGIDWRLVESPRNWSSIACDATGNKLVAVVNNGQIYTSTDSGSTWVPRESVRNWKAVASNASGTNLVAIVYGGQIYTSSDSGVNWMPRDVNRNWNSVSSSAPGQRLVATVDTGRIYYSSDFGATWTADTSPGSDQNWNSVSMNSTGLIIVATTSTSGQIYRSTDGGINFNVLPSSPAQNWGGVATNSDGSVIVGVVAGGFIYQSMDNGATWNTRYFAQVLDWNYVYCNNSDIGNARFIASVSNGQLYLSQDKGINWNPTNNTRPWTSVACNGNFFRLFGTVSNQSIQIGQSNTKNTDSFIVKYNFNGECDWITYCQGGQNQAVSCVYNPVNKNIIVSGRYNLLLNAYDSNDFGVVSAIIPRETNSDVWDAYILSYNSNGIIEWENRIVYPDAGFADINCMSMYVDSIGNIYITGNTYHSPGLKFYNSSGELGTTLILPLTFKVSFCAKYYLNGVVQSVSSLSSSNFSSATTDFAFSMNNIILIGKVQTSIDIYNSDNTLYSNLTTANPGNVGTFILSLTPNNSPSFVVNPPSYSNPYQAEFLIGGGSKSLVNNYPVDNPIETWGGQTGFTPSSVLIPDLSAGVICRYGHELGNTRPFVSGLPSTSASKYRCLAVSLSEPSFPINDPQPETSGSVIYGYLPFYIQTPNYATGVVFNTQLYNSSNLIMTATGPIVGGQSFGGLSVGDVIRLIIIDPLSTGQYINLTVKGFIVSDSSVLPNIPAAVIFEESTYYVSIEITPSNLGLPRETYTPLLPDKSIPAFFQPKIIKQGKLHVILKLYNKYAP
jgi:photosystem II stability/assembly factor-like uncharacterized protein